MNVGFSIILTISFVFCNILITRIIRRNFSNIYFSYKDLFLIESSDLNFIKIFTVYIVPFLFSIILSIWIKMYKLEFVLLYGFLAPFLITCPVMLHPDEMLDPDLYTKKNSVFIIYFSHIAGFMVMSYFGYKTYEFVYSFLSPEGGISYLKEHLLSIIVSKPA